MLKWLKENLGFSFGPLTDERVLAFERETQSMRLKTEELGRSLAILKSDLEQYCADEATRTAEAVRAKIEKLMTDLAAPATQLFTQAHRLEVEGQPAQAKDVLEVAKRLLRALEDEGLKLEGRVGETVSFDPDRHDPPGDAALAAGQSVVVRFAGAAYRDKLLRKAEVEKL